jgi:hypothetical protein
MLALKFGLKFTTPYDYIDIFSARFPWNSSIENALNQILDLAIALPFCAVYSSEEIFFGTLETIFQAKHMNLNPTQKNILLSMTDTWAKAS